MKKKKKESVFFLTISFCCCCIFLCSSNGLQNSNKYGINNTQRHNNSSTYNKIKIIAALTIRIEITSSGRIIRAPPTRTASSTIASKKHQALQWQSSCQVYLKQKIDNDPVVRLIKIWFVWWDVTNLKYNLQYKHHSCGTTPTLKVNSWGKFGAMLYIHFVARSGW